MRAIPVISLCAVAGLIFSLSYYRTVQAPAPGAKVLPSRAAQPVPAHASVAALPANNSTNVATNQIQATQQSAALTSPVIYLDPTTGKIVPAPGQLNLRDMPMTPELKNAFSTSSEGLKVEPGTTPAGGFKVDLKGRFNQVTVVALDGHGNLKSTTRTPSVVTPPQSPVAGDKPQ